jgi:hypothetical protein
MAMRYPQGVDVAAAMAAGFVLDRCEAVPALIGETPRISSSSPGLPALPAISPR